MMSEIRFQHSLTTTSSKRISNEDRKKSIETEDPSAAEAEVEDTTVETETTTDTTTATPEAEAEKGAEEMNTEEQAENAVQSEAKKADIHRQPQKPSN